MSFRLFQHAHLSVAFFLPGYMVDNRSKIGRAIQLDSLQALVVSLKDALHPVAVWVIYITILQREHQRSINNYVSTVKVKSAD